MKRQLKIRLILSEFRGLKNIPAVKGLRHASIAKITNDQGRSVTDKKGIADVFADFYEKLYESRFGAEPSHQENLPRIGNPTISPMSLD